ncbi:hypothetical protein BpHYR1_009300 [Brachionus plicatilis]|uniref:Uncharacterized protein n=1 Tax=Brachionus plicatilis TaxID=10195 RepID=A0A3M7S6Z6_BRAPC|nr:hypothetical protein BpHYR1_009300 [Brachionus plicatilis]
MFGKKTVTIFLFISEISKLVGGKTCKFYPSYPEYGNVYSVELPCFVGLSIVAIVVIGVCMYLITRKIKIQPLEAAQSNAKQDVNSRKRVSKYSDPFMINPIPTYQIQTQDQEVMPYIPNSSIISNRGFYTQNENIY